MVSGLFINNDLLSLATLGDDGNVEFFGTEGEKEHYLWFTYNKAQPSPLKLDREARALYYPGNGKIRMNLLRLADLQLKNAGSTDPKIKWNQILDQVVEKFLSDNLRSIPSAKDKKNIRPFFLIVPPYISPGLRSLLKKSVGRRIKDVRLLEYVIPSIFSLFKDDKYPSGGNILMMDLNPPDIWFSVVSVAGGDNRFRSAVEKTDAIRGTDMYLKATRIVAEEIVESAFFLSRPHLLSDPEAKEREVLFHMPDAQDIITELNDLDEWSSVEVEINLSDGTTCPVMVYKEKLRERFHQLPESGILKDKLDHLIQKFHPHTVGLNGAIFNNPFFKELIKSYKDVNLITLPSDHYQAICRTVLEYSAVVDDLVSGKWVPMELPVQAVAGKAEEIAAEEAVPFVRPEGERTQAVKRKIRRIILAVLLPLVALGAIYTGIRLFSGSGREDRKVTEVTKIHEEPPPETLTESVVPADTMKKPVEQARQDSSLPDERKTDISNAEQTVPTEITPPPPEPDFLSVDRESIETIPITGEKMKLTVSSNIPWEIVQVPAWLSVQPGSGKGGKTEIVMTITGEVSDTQDVGLMIMARENPDLQKAIAIKFHTSWQWTYDDLVNYVESIRNKSQTINPQELYLHVDPGCEVYTYYNGQRTGDSQNVMDFLKEQRLGVGTKKIIVSNSLIHNARKKIIEFSVE